MHIIKLSHPIFNCFQGRCRKRFFSGCPDAYIPHNNDILLKVQDFHLLSRRNLVLGEESLSDSRLGKGSKGKWMAGLGTGPLKSQNRFFTYNIHQCSAEEFDTTKGNLQLPDSQTEYWEEGVTIILWNTVLYKFAFYTVKTVCIHVKINWLKVFKH